MEVKCKRFDSTLPLPHHVPGAAAGDLFCREDTEIPPQEIKLVPLNLTVEVPEGYVLLLFIRSSTPLRHGLMLANSVGVIDPFYCGEKDEVLAELYNFTAQPVSLKRGERVAQALLLKNEPIEWQEVAQMSKEGEGYDHRKPDSWTTP